MSRVILAARPSAKQYIVAVLMGGLALLPLFAAGEQAAPGSLLLLILAVIVSSRYGGLGPGLLAALVGGFLNLYFFLSGISSPTGNHLVAGLQLDTFVLVGVSICFFLESLRRTQKHLEYQSSFSDAMTCNPEEGVLGVDTEGRVTFANRAAEQMLGWTEAEVLGEDAHHLLHPSEESFEEDSRLDQCSLLRALNTGDSLVSGEESLFAKDGTSLHTALTLCPVVTEGQCVGKVVTFRDITQRKHGTEQLRESEERYRTLVETSPDGIVLTDAYGYTDMANRTAAHLHGYESGQELVGTRWMDLVAPEDRLRAVEDERRAAVEGTIRDLEYRMVKRDGTSFPAEICTSAILDKEEAFQGLIHVTRDITERRRTEHTLRTNERQINLQHAATAVLARAEGVGEAISNLLKVIGEGASWQAGAFWTLDERTNLMRCQAFWHSPSCELPGFGEVTRQLAFARGVGLVGRVWETARPIWASDVITDKQFQRALMAAKEDLHGALCVPVLVDGSVQSAIEFFSSTPREIDEDLMQTMTTISAQAGQFIERRRAEKALEHQALHDALTGLPNRVLLHERLQRALQAARTSRTTLAMLLMDLDRFKEVNDTFGHQYGDMLLQQVSLRLQSVLRDSDTVSRLGGDEFAALLPATDVMGATLVADKILKDLQEPYVVEGQHLDVGASIGIAVFPEHAEDATTLMQRADVAMYAAKRARAGFATYASDQDEHSPDRITRITDLRQAIEEERLLLHYQPKVDLKTGSVDGVEALARWHHATDGFIPPAVFIPLAEQHGLIKPLSYWVMSEALCQCRMWHNDDWDLSVAVNLSAENLHDPELVDTVARLLETHGADPDWLEVEVTESAIMSDSPRALESLRQLHDMGVRIAIDDFGTGYSSLAYLKRLPVDEIKIDMSFVVDMATHEDDAFIARSVVDLGHNLGLEVVAEGVEDQEVWTMLNAMGCDRAQGQYLSHPLPPGELRSWMTRLRRGQGIVAISAKLDERRSREQTGA